MTFSVYFLKRASLKLGGGGSDTLRGEVPDLHSALLITKESLWLLNSVPNL